MELELELKMLAEIFTGLAGELSAQPRWSRRLQEIALAVVGLAGQREQRQFQLQLANILEKL